MYYFRDMNKLRESSKELPSTNHHSESEYLLCYEANGSSEPVVCWYNSNTKTWRVAHRLASNEPVKVKYWTELPKTPKKVLND